MNDVVIKSLVQMRQRITQCEQAIARTSYSDNQMYKLGRDQGFLVGLEEAVRILEGVIEENDN